MFKTCGGGSWRLLGGFGGGGNASSQGINGLSVAGKIAHIAIDFSSPPQARRLLISASVSDTGGEIWSFDPARKQGQQWLFLLKASGAFDFTSQGPHTFESAPGLALAVSGNNVTLINLRTFDWSITELHGCCSGGLAATAIVPTTTPKGSLSIPVLIGGHCKYGPYGPVVVAATIPSLGAGNGTSTRSCSLVYDFEAPTTPGVASMTVSSLVADPRSAKTVVAGLHVGDYYDGDLPQHLWATATAGQSWCAVGVDIPNAMITSMQFAPDLRLCASSDGDGVQCFDLDTVCAEV